MNLSERLNRLQFYDNVILNPQIGEILSHNFTFVRDVDGFLLLDSESQLFKLNPKSVLIHFFEEAGAQRIVNFVSAADDYFSEVIVFHCIASRPSVLSAFPESYR